MATYLFRGITLDGERIGGAKKLNNKEQVVQFTNELDLAKVEVYESETIFAKGEYSLVSRREMSVFCKQMNVIMKSHLPLLEGVLLESEQTDNKTLKKVLVEVHGFMLQGISFAEALMMYNHIFSEYMLSMVNIGETTGTLDRAFLELSHYYEKEDTIHKEVKRTLTYPLYLTSIITVAIVLIVVKILPVFSDILSSFGSENYVLTRIVLGLSNFLNSYLFILLGIIVVFMFIGIGYMRTERGVLLPDKLKLKLPIISDVYKKIICYRFIRCLSVMLNAGISFPQSFELAITVINNKQIEPLFETALQDIKNGQPLDVCLESTGVFPHMYLRMIVIGQNTGYLDQMLNEASVLLESDVDESLYKLTALVEPTIMVVLSLVVILMLVSIVLPMIDIMNSII